MRLRPQSPHKKIWTRGFQIISSQIVNAFPSLPVPALGVWNKYAYTAHEIGNRKWNSAWLFLSSYKLPLLKSLPLVSFLPFPHSLRSIRLIWHYISLTTDTASFNLRIRPIHYFSNPNLMWGGTASLACLMNKTPFINTGKWLKNSDRFPSKKIYTWPTSFPKNQLFLLLLLHLLLQLLPSITLSCVFEIKYYQFIVNECLTTQC